MVLVTPRSLPPYLPHLHRAAALGDESRIKQQLAAGHDVNARDNEGVTALLWSVYGGHTSACIALLAAGADPSISDNSQCCPLYMAAQEGLTAIAEALILADADMDAVLERPDAGTALFKASATGDKAMVKLLLGAGCSTSKTAAGGHPPLTAASLQGHTEVVRLLVDAGADVNAVGAKGSNALTAAAQKGSCDIFKILLEKGADVNQPGIDGTALHMAVYHGFDEATNVLIAAGANVDQGDDRRDTPLHTAAGSGSLNCTYALLRAGASVSARNLDGSSPLLLAAAKGNTDVIEVLLSGGAQADVNLEDSMHRTPLISASAFADAKAVHLLIDAGADVNRSDATNGRTALFFPSDVKIVKALLDRGANVKVVDKLGLTVLHSAGGRGVCTAVICALFKAGVDPTVKDIMGKTAADLARREGHDDAAKLLDLLEAKYRATHST